MYDKNIASISIQHQKQSRIKMIRTFFLIIFVMILWYVFVLLFIHQAEPSLDEYQKPVLKQLPVLNWCKKLRFQVPPSENTVALVSFPGSGNTWLRYLLQQATGIYTGSIYMDTVLRRTGFPAEGVKNGSVLVVKTHEGTPLEQRQFNSAILLTRNPRDAILAEFNRLYRGHRGIAPKSAFKIKTLVDYGTIVGPYGKNYSAERYLDWNTFVPARLKKWETMHTTWLVKFRGPLLIVTYEELVLDLRNILQKVLDFLQFKYTESDLVCTMRNREGIYQRQSKHTDFNPFTIEMLAEIRQAELRVHDIMFRFKKITVTKKKKLLFQSFI